MWDDGDLEDQVQRCTSRLQEHVRGPGAHVGLLAPNGPGFVFAAVACRRLGGVLAPLAPDLPDRVLAERVQQVGLDLIMASGDDASRTAGFAPGVPLVTDSGVGSHPRPAPFPGARDPADDLAILFSSGTTGPAQAWVYPEESVEAHARAAGKRLDFSDGSVSLGVLPLHHAGGFMGLDRVIRSDGTLVLEDRFDAHRVISLLREHAVTHVSLVPVMFSRILEADPEPPEGLRCVLLGGDAAPPGLLQRACDHGWPVYPSYGLTETCSQVATATPEDACGFPGTVGRALEGVEVSIVDDHGALCAQGEEGTIVVRGATLARPWSGKRLDRIHTEDRGYQDDAGRLVVTGRTMHRIVTGGHTVNALAVEASLESVPGVRAACVVGVPDPAWGQVVGAVVEAEAAGTGDAEDNARILDPVRKDLAPYAVPRHVLWTDRVPRTSIGKKDRTAVRELLVSKDRVRA